jgi:hypothetical protein
LRVRSGGTASAWSQYLRSQGVRQAGAVFVQFGGNGRIMAPERIMEDPATKTKAAGENTSAVQQVKEAHTLLQTLRERLDRHPELEQAIEKLEEALNLLTVKTGGML